VRKYKDSGKVRELMERRTEGRISRKKVLAEAYTCCLLRLKFGTCHKNAEVFIF